MDLSPELAYDRVISKRRIVGVFPELVAFAGWKSSRDRMLEKIEGT